MTQTNTKDQKAKIKDILAKMTLEQKATLCDGADSWHLKSYDELGIPRVMVADGPHGLRKGTHRLKARGSWAACRRYATRQRSPLPVRGT